MPIIVGLVGSNGPGWAIHGRAIGFHVAEAACSFMLAKSTENAEKQLLADAASRGWDVTQRRVVAFPRGCWCWTPDVISAVAQSPEVLKMLF